MRLHAVSNGGLWAFMQQQPETFEQAIAKLSAIVTEAFNRGDVKTCASPMRRTPLCCSRIVHRLKDETRSNHSSRDTRRPAQSSHHDPSAPEPIPEHEFDQRVSW